MSLDRIVNYLLVVTIGLIVVTIIGNLFYIQYTVKTFEVLQGEDYQIPKVWRDKVEHMINRNRADVERLLERAGISGEDEGK